MAHAGPITTDLRRYLRVLELEEISARETLDANAIDLQFKRLIKVYHPDRNPGRAEWAHGKSRELIEASRALRAYLDRHGPLRPQAATFRTRTVEPATASRPAPENAPPAPPRVVDPAFQLIEGGRVNYAFPVQRIVRILAPGDPAVRRGFPGPFCFFEGELYPLHSLEDDGLRWEDAGFVVLLRTRQVREGIVLSRDSRFASIAHFRVADLLRRQTGHDTRGIWIRHGLRVYLCPAELLVEPTPAVASA